MLRIFLASSIADLLVVDVVWQEDMALSMSPPELPMAFWVQLWRLR